MSFLSLVAPKKGTPVRTNVSVSGSSPTLLVAANKNRKSLVIQNQGAVTVFLGDSSVTASGANTGFALYTETSMVDNASDGAWYAIPASASANLNITEIS